LAIVGTPLLRGVLAGGLLRRSDHLGRNVGDAWRCGGVVLRRLDLGCGDGGAKCLRGRFGGRAWRGRGGRCR
jgi:hypothetical protein